MVVTLFVFGCVVRGKVKRYDASGGDGREKARQTQESARPSRMSHEDHCRPADTLGQRSILLPFPLGVPFGTEAPTSH